jgi:hypothetical protein
VIRGPASKKFRASSVAAAVAALSAWWIIARALLRIRSPAQTPIATEESSTNPTMLQTRVGFRPTGNQRRMPCGGASVATAGMGMANLKSSHQYAPITRIEVQRTTKAMLDWLDVLSIDWYPRLNVKSALRANRDIAVVRK